MIPPFIKSALKNKVAKAKALFANQKSRRDIKGFLEFGVGYAITLIVGFFLIRTVNLTLTQEEIGKYSFIASLAAILSPVLYFSAPQAYLRFHQNHKISIHLRRFLIPFFYGAVLLLAGVIWCYTHSLIALLYAFLPIFTEKTYLLRCQMNITKLNILKIIELLLPLLILLGLNHYQVEANANVILFLYGVGYLVSYLFKARDLNDAPVEKRTVLKYLWPTIFTALLGMFLTNSAVFFTKIFFGYEMAGLMGVAAKAVIFVSSLFGLFLMFYPMIYVREAEGGNLKLIRFYRRIVMTVALLACIFFTVFSKQVYWVIGAEKYYEYRHLFVGLVWIAFFNFVGDIYWLYFAYEIKTWKSTLLKTGAMLIILSGIWAATRFGMNYIIYLLLFAVAVPALAGAVWALNLERKQFKNKESSAL